MRMVIVFAFTSTIVEIERPSIHATNRRVGGKQNDA